MDYTQIHDQKSFVDSTTSMVYKNYLDHDTAYKSSFRLKREKLSFSVTGSLLEKTPNF